MTLGVLYIGYQVAAVALLAFLVARALVRSRS